MVLYERSLVRQEICSCQLNRTGVMRITTYRWQTLLNVLEVISLYSNPTVIFGRLDLPEKFKHLPVIQNVQASSLRKYQVDLASQFGAFSVLLICWLPQLYCIELYSRHFPYIVHTFSMGFWSFSKISSSFWSLYSVVLSFGWFLDFCRVCARLFIVFLKNRRRTLSLSMSFTPCLGFALFVICIQLRDFLSKSWKGPLKLKLKGSTKILNVKEIKISRVWTRS